jgi:hypothetical protein
MVAMDRRQTRQPRADDAAAFSVSRPARRVAA